MRTLNFLFFLLFFIVNSGQAQKYFTKSGQISFYSDTPLEKIEAHSKTAVAVVDTETGNLEFSVLVKSFHFEKALMEEHFNENYMESHKYPKAVFKGKILDISKLNFSKDGNFSVKVSGQLTMHGVTKDIATAGSITVKGNEVICLSEFDVAVADYKIEIPTLVKDNIAKSVKIKINASLQPLKNK